MIFSTDTLEYLHITKRIKEYIFSDKARNMLENITPKIKLENVRTDLLQTNEVLGLIVKYGSFPFLENFDNTIINSDQTIERIYNIEELMIIKLFLKMEQDFHTYFSYLKENDKIGNIKKHIDLYNHIRLLTQFNQTFTDYGEIMDDATVTLKQVRTKIKKLQFDLDNKMHKLLKTYEPYLSESVIVTRNNRYCLSVKESYKNKVRGIIHDISASKQTIFIEPEISLEINAEIELTKILEEKEIIIILSNISNLVDNNITTLKQNLYHFSMLDFIHAKAKYSLDINGIMPKINNEGYINLINAKHPILDLKKAVPISLEISKKNNILLITGPNTGGKTVALKTVGLLTLMVQTGILVPVNEESSFAIFDNIFADIGDEQSIINSLSTFSSHMAKIVKFINNLSDNSLILLDELGSGTDPNEGVALAIAILEEFNKKDVRLVVTSHYSELKTYAFESEGIITASVAFDKDSLKPLYYLKHGISGDSHARLITKRLGMVDSVIDKANELYAKRETDLAKIISKLNDERTLLEQEQLRIKQIEENYLDETLKLQELKTKLLNEQNSILDSVRKKEEQKWQDKMAEVDILLEEIDKNKDVKEHLVANLKGAIKEKPQKEALYDKSQIINVGDKVYISSYQQYGTVKEINNNKYRVVFGIFDLNFKLSDLKKHDDEKAKVLKTKPKKQIQKHSTIVDKDASMSVDLRGYRYEEVKEALDKAIDRALISNLHSLSIIHGFGTGAVRTAVYEYINKSKLIASHRYGREGEGLNGVTIITLK